MTENIGGSEVLLSKPAKIRQLLSNLTSLNQKLSENHSLEEKISETAENLKSLTKKISYAKAERDMIIGKNFVSTTQSSESLLEQKKFNLEDTLVKVKLEYGRICENLMESEDTLQLCIESCKAQDLKIATLHNELEMTKMILPLTVKNPEYKAPSSSQNQPIQLNRKVFHTRKSESLGK